MSSTTDLPEFHKKYKLGIVLGEGNFSTVRECITNDNDRVRHAVKIVKVTGNKEKREATKTMMLGEVSIMQKMDNVNIIKCIDSFFGSEAIFVVLESTRVCKSFLFISCYIVYFLYFHSGMALLLRTLHMKFRNSY